MQKQSVTVFNNLLLLISLCLFSNNILATLKITESFESSDEFTIQYLYDKDNILSIDDIVKIKFNQDIPNQFALGYRTGSAWFKITVDNQSTNNQFILYFSEPFWTTLDLYLYQNKRWTTQRNGLETPLIKRSIHNSYPTFPLELNTQQTTTYYLKGTTVSSHIGEFKLLTRDEFYKSGRITISDVFNIYSGVLFFIVLLTILLYLKMRERLYIYYASYVMTFIIWLNAENASYLYLSINGWKNALHYFGSLFVLFLVLFSKELLQLKKHEPHINNAFNISAVIIFISGVGISQNIQHVGLFFNIFSSLFFTLLLITAIKAWNNNYFSGARYYLFALIIYMPTMALMTLTYNGLMPNLDTTRYAFIVGSFIEILLFSFILMSRFIEVKNQKLSIQRELIIEKDKQAKILEEEVESRTNDLNKTNKKLLEQTHALEVAKQQLDIEAKTDPLSGLSNRRYLLEHAVSLFNKAKELRQPMSILMLDIDRFKGINDNFGHHIGDKAIISCSNIFKSLTNEADIVARYGGEEFVILADKITLNKALELAEKIRKDIEESPICSIGDKKLFLTLSIGVTEMNIETDTSIDNMLQRADKALYIAKNEGRNTVISLKS